MSYDACNSKCKEIDCVDDLNLVITKATLHQVQEYVSTHCSTAIWRYDKQYRLPVHVAASCGKSDVLEWIVSLIPQFEGTRSADINAVDGESHWSALHRAVYYGRIPCIITLLKRKANVWIKDKDGCNIFDIMLQDTAPWYQKVVSKKKSCAMSKNTTREESEINKILAMPFISTSSFGRDENLSFSYPESTVEDQLYSIRKLNKPSWSGLDCFGSNELYTWGFNENLTLAQEGAKSKIVPEPVPKFAKQKISIKQVVLCKFHSIFLTRDGDVYSCGNGGHSGRLGVGRETVCIEPQRIGFGNNTKFKMVAASTYHTVLVSDKNQLFTCGLNHYRVLGIKPPPNKVDRPTHISFSNQEIVGCSAGMYHTAAWSEYQFFTFGTNAGQLGQAKGDEFIIQPRGVSAVNDRSVVLDAHACDSATVVATSLGVVYLLHNYVCRKIVNHHSDLWKVRVGGGSLPSLDYSVISKIKSFQASQPQIRRDDISGADQRPLRVLIAKTTGDMFSWTSTHSAAGHCIYDTKELRTVRDVAISNDGKVVMLVSGNGTAYFAHYLNWHKGKKKSSSHKKEYFRTLDLVNQANSQEMKLDQIPRAFRAHTAVIGPNGRNFALLQNDPLSFITEKPIVDGNTLKEDLQAFWLNTSETDAIHDVTIRLKNRSSSDVFFPAHLFVLAARSSAFAEIIKAKFEPKETNHPDNSESASGELPLPHLVVEQIPLEIFKVCLELMYTGRCLSLGKPSTLRSNFSKQSGDIKIYWEGQRDLFNLSFPVKKDWSKGKSNSSSNVSTTLLTNYVKLLGVFGAEKCEFLYPEAVDLKFTFSSQSLPSLYDCEVECDDAVSYSAHKCVLAARIPYFHGMLYSSWLETSGENLAMLKVSMPSDIFGIVLDFAYSDSEESVGKLKSLERCCELMAAADCLLMERLKQISQAKIVPLVDMKNIAMVMSVASTFNSTELLKPCLQLACHNLPHFLQTTLFNSLDMETLEQLENYYRSILPDVHMRAMPASFEGPCIDHIPPFGDESSSSFRSKSNQLFGGVLNSSKRRNDKQFSRRKFSGKNSFGTLLSDLLNTPKKDPEQEFLETRNNCAPVLPDVPTETDSSESVIHVKAKSQKKSRIAAAEKSSSVKSLVAKSNTHQSTSASKGLDINHNRPQDDTAFPAPSKQKVKPVQQTTANINYVRLFPELGDASKESPAVSKRNRNPKPTNNGLVKSEFSGPLIIKSKKKLSKKEKRRLEKEAATKKRSEDIENRAAPNAWGIPIKSPEQSGKSICSTNPFEESSSFSYSVPIAKSPPPSSQGVWQRFSAALVSPPRPTMHRSNSSAFETPEKPLQQSFLEILQDEQLQKDIEERHYKKPMALIQLEDQAMYELKKHYESNYKGDKVFFTVSRIPEDRARAFAATRELNLKK